jgi:predicted nucleic acid-binding protein
MEYVFLDTSVFEKNNFLEGNRITELLKLSEDKEIRIVLTQITYNEIISRFRKNIIGTREAFKTFRNRSRVFKNLPSKIRLFDTVEEENLVTEFTISLDERLTRAKCIIMRYSKVDISSIFDNYFSMKSPFGEGQKKDEFPDAFALLMLEKWCDKYKRKCHVLSTDDDMLSYEHPNLIISPNYEDFLDAKLRAMKAMKAIVDASLDFLSENEGVIEFLLIEWATTDLSNESKYFDLVNHMKYTILMFQTLAYIWNHQKLSVQILTMLISR